jgi:hypothetical protein
MTHPIIKTENYLLVVDDGRKYPIDCKYRYIYVDDKITQISIQQFQNYVDLIIYHLPLNNAPIIEGVPLLPPIEEDISNLTFQAYKEQDKWTWGEFKDIFPAGYNKAKEKYMFTKEDLFMLAAKVVNDIAKNKGNTDWNMFTTPKMIAEEFIQQPKYPVAFEIKMKVVGITDDGDNYIEQPKTITNLQGLTHVVGNYIY